MYKNSMCDDRSRSILGDRLNFDLTRQFQGFAFSATGSAITTTLAISSLPVFSFRRLCWRLKIRSVLTRIETRYFLIGSNKFLFIACQPRTWRSKWTGWTVNLVLIYLSTDIESLWLLLHDRLHDWNRLESHRLRIGPPQRSFLPIGV